MSSAENDLSESGVRPPAPYDEPRIPRRPGDLEVVEAIKFGWEKVKEHPISVAIALVFALISQVIGFITGGIKLALIMGMDDQHAAQIIGVFIDLASIPFSMALTAYLTIGVVRISMNVLAGRPPELPQLFSGTEFLVPMVLAALLVGLGTMAGMFLCIVPGVIIALGTQFYGFCVVDRRLGAWEAIVESWRLTDGFKGQLFVFALLAFLVMFAGLIACGVGVLVAIPVLWFAHARIYDILSGGAVGGPREIEQVFA